MAVVVSTPSVVPAQVLCFAIVVSPATPVEASAAQVAVPGLVVQDTPVLVAEMIALFL